MEKLICENQDTRTRRNTSFCKTSKLHAPQQFEQLPTIPLQEIKTVKILNKKQSKIPFLNLANLRHIQRPKVLSLNNKFLQKVKTERHNTQQSEGNVSFFLDQNIMNIANKKSMAECKNLSEKTKKSCVFPPIIHQGFTTPLKLEKQILMRQKSNESKKRKSKMNVHCKVLLARNSHFPFIGSNYFQSKKTEMSKTKQIENPQHAQLFNLNISRIIEIEEPISPAFLSKESLQQIAIF